MKGQNTYAKTVHTLQGPTRSLQVHTLQGPTRSLPVHTLQGPTRSLPCTTPSPPQYSILIIRSFNHAHLEGLVGPPVNGSRGGEPAPHPRAVAAAAARRLGHVLGRFERRVRRPHLQVLRAVQEALVELAHLETRVIKGREEGIKRACTTVVEAKG